MLELSEIQQIFFFKLDTSLIRVLQVSVFDMCVQHGHTI